MSAQIINGREIARQIRESLQSQLIGIKLRLGILCSDNAPSLSYYEAINRVAKSLGIEVRLSLFRAGSSQREFESIIAEWNRDPGIHGIFVLQPMFDGINVDELRALVHPLKDIECVHPFNSSLRYLSKERVGSCTAMAIMEVLKSLKIDLAGAEVVVVGHSRIVGHPVSEMLIRENATVTTCNKATSDKGFLRKHIEGADILIVAVGKAHFIPGRWIKVGSTVVDVGVNDVGEGKFVGDVEFDTACERAAFITPVLGGVGPVTAIIGMRQLLVASQLQQKFYSVG